MHQHVGLGFLILALLGPAQTLSAEGPSLGQDLKAVIALHGFLCDQLVDSKRNGDSDYTASCKDRNRYHIFVDSSGRVVVKKF
jgi:hypothetical protein